MISKIDTKEAFFNSMSNLEKILCDKIMLIMKKKKIIKIEWLKLLKSIEINRFMMKQMNIKKYWISILIIMRKL